MRVAREMIGGPFARPAFTFVAVVTRQVVSRRSTAGQVRLVLRAVKSRRLDLVSCSFWREGGREGGGEGGSQKPELPVAPAVAIEKFQDPSPSPGVRHNYGPPPSHTRVHTFFPAALARICSNLSATPAR